MLIVDASVWVASFDQRDRFHAPSAVFLREVAKLGLALHGPALVTLEVACALARRAGDPSVGAIADERLRGHPSLRLHPLDDGLLDAARQLGIQRMLRGADALYAATASVLDAPLVTWNEELMRRSGGLTPDGWLATRGSL